MSLGPSGHAALLRDLARRDRLREGPGTLAAGARHTEWYHFIVLAADTTLLVNLSFSVVGPRGEIVPRLLVAVHHEGWHAVLREFPLSACDLQAGRVDVSLGENSLRLGDGGYRIQARVQGLRVDLTLVPEAHAVFARDARLGDGAMLSWLAIPRLRAVGTVEVDGCTLPLTGAPAYHDHNWGGFDWGGDFAWEWGFAMPAAESRWCFLYYRILDRRRLAVRQQGVWAWRDNQLVGVFRDGQVKFHAGGFRRYVEPVVVPAQLSSLAPGALGLPRAFSWEARNEGGFLEGCFRGRNVLQIVAPGASDLSIVNEVDGEAWISGELEGERLDLRGPALLEIANA